MNWFPVPRYSPTQCGACRNCEGLTILRLMPAGLLVRALVCCKCGRVAGMWQEDG